MTLVGQQAIHILNFLQDKNFAYRFREGRLNSTVRNMQAWLTKLKDEGTTKKGIFKIKNIRTMLESITKACIKL